jgi:hypothetical protein
MGLSKILGQIGERVRHAKSESRGLLICKPKSLSDSAGTPGFLRVAPIDPFEQISKLRRSDGNPSVSR